MGAAQKLAIRDAGGKVIAIDVTRRFPPEAFAAADRAESALNDITIAAFVPLAGLVGKGAQFDPDEPWPSDKTAREYAPQPVSASYTTGAVSGGIRAAGEVAYNPPPNCDFVSHGEALAHAQHKAAEGGEGCDSVACSMTRGAND